MWLLNCYRSYWITWMLNWMIVEYNFVRCIEIKILSEWKIVSSSSWKISYTMWWYRPYYICSYYTWTYYTCFYYTWTYYTSPYYTSAYYYTSTILLLPGRFHQERQLLLLLLHCQEELGRCIIRLYSNEWCCNTCPSHDEGNQRLYLQWVKYSTVEIGPKRVNSVKNSYRFTN